MFIESHFQYANTCFVFSYWIFEKQGRISTIIGNKTQTEYKIEEDAVNAFMERFKELTGNDFVEHEFVKKPGKFQLMDIDYGRPMQILEHLPQSQLNASVYKVMKLICDEKAMKVSLYLH